MPKKRIYVDNPYLLTTNCRFRIESFRNFLFAKILAKIIQKKALELKCKIFSFQIMPEHIHIIMQSYCTTISKYMQQVKSFFYHQVRANFDCQSKFWQKGFDYQILESEEDIFIALRYLANNPGKAGLDQIFFAYPYAFLDAEEINRYLY